MNLKIPGQVAIRDIASHAYGAGQAAADAKRHPEGSSHAKQYCDSYGGKQNIARLQVDNPGFFFRVRQRLMEIHKHLVDLLG